MRDAVKLIEANLAEEKKTDKDLTVLAEFDYQRHGRTAEPGRIGIHQRVSSEPRQGGSEAEPLGNSRPTVALIRVSGKVLPLKRSVTSEIQGGSFVKPSAENRRWQKSVSVSIPAVAKKKWETKCVAISEAKQRAAKAVRSRVRKQAIAIGLSKARKKGKKVPRKKR